MVLDLALATVFLGSAFALWYRVSVKIPELAAIPDQVITERFHEDSAKLRLFILQIKTYYKEERYKPVFWKYLARFLYKTHLALLRTDNALVTLLKHIKAKNDVTGIPVNGSLSDSEYWQKLQDPPPSSLSKTRIVEEVRKRE